jgi:ABC-type nickel/cobalt efflux system permease component RcnA
MLTWNIFRTVFRPSYRMMLHTKMAVFWVVAPCGLVQVYHCFRSPFRRHHQGRHHRSDDGPSKNLWNIGKLIPDCTALQPRRQPSTYSPPWGRQILPILRTTCSFLRQFCFITTNRSKFRIQNRPFQTVGLLITGDRSLMAEIDRPKPTDAVDHYHHHHHNHHHHHRRRRRRQPFTSWAQWLFTVSTGYS